MEYLSPRKKFLKLLTEIKLKGEFENRELRINFATKRAVSIIVDSEYGKSNLSKKYNIEEACIICVLLRMQLVLSTSKKRFTAIEGLVRMVVWFSTPSGLHSVSCHQMLIQLFNIVTRRIAIIMEYLDVCSAC